MGSAASKAARQLPAASSRAARAPPGKDFPRPGPYNPEAGPAHEDHELLRANLRVLGQVQLNASSTAGTVIAFVN